MHATGLGLPIRAIVSLLFFFSALVGSHAKANDHRWDSIVSTVHQVAEIVRRGEAAEPWRVMRVTGELETLLESPDQITSFLEYAYGRGLLHLDGFKNDLLYLQEQLEGPLGGAASKRLVEMGFGRFALYLADVPKRESVLTDEELERRGTTSSSDGTTNYALPGHSPGTTIEERAWKALAELQKQYADMAAKSDAFVQAGERFETRVWWGHTIAAITFAALGLHEGFELLEVGKMSAKELIALMGGIWAANAGGYFVLWQWSGILEWFKPFVERTKYHEVKDAWQNLMTQLPVLAARNAGAAAQDKLVDPTTRMDAYSMAPFEALLDTKTNESTEQLFALALQFLQNGHLSLARRAFREIDKRTPQEALRNLTKAVEAAFKAKRGLENRVFRRQFAGMVLRLASVALGLWAVNEAIKWVMPEWVREWAKVPTAVFAALGLNRVLKFLWKPAKRERVDQYTQSDRKALADAFGNLMKADPTGEVLRRMAVNRSSTATQAIVTEEAVNAMSNVHSGRVTLEMYRMWRDTLASTAENGDRVQHLITKTYDQHRGCLRELINVSSTLGERLRPAVAAAEAAAAMAVQAPAVTATQADSDRNGPPTVSSLSGAEIHQSDPPQ